MKEGENMKKVITACFDLLIDFDDTEEVQRYLNSIHTGYVVLEQTTTAEGKQRVHLLKQYNNNEMPQGRER